MSAVLNIVDQHFGSGSAERRPAMSLRLASERVTARELIRRRVADEVEALNRNLLEHAEGQARTRSFLVPLDVETAEARLNMPKLRRAKVRLFDGEAESERAICAFEQRKFIMLVDDRQIDGLDEPIILTPASEAAFLYLTPLVGG